MSDEQKTRVKGYIETLDSSVPSGELLDLVLDIVVDRVLLYLNETEIAVNLERVIAQVVVGAYKQTVAVTTPGTNQSISTISDNGQSVSYRISPAQYLATQDDQELFSGFERLLNSYRRPHVITS